MKTSAKTGAGNITPKAIAAELLVAPGSNIPSPTGVVELLAAGRLLAGPQEMEDRRPYVLLRDKDGSERLEFLPFADEEPLPSFTRQRVTLNDPDSFARYVKKYSKPDTTIFATLPPAGECNGKGASFTAIFDYHAGGRGEEAKPDRCAHIAVYPCPLSLPWKTWVSADKKGMGQNEFINFIDANMPDIVAPPGAVLMEIAANFEAHSQAEFTSRIDRFSGGVKLTYKEEVDQRTTAGEMKLPQFIGLTLPVFDGGKPFDLQARIEYRVNSGKLTISYHLQQPYNLLRKALEDLRQEIALTTNIEPLTGEAQGIG